MSNDATKTEQWTHVGLECKIVKQEQGHWCGYVRRPESIEPVRWQGDYDSKHNEVLDADVEVWGSVTYGPDEDGWVGFDDAHARSLVNHRTFDTAKEAIKAETESLAKQIQSLDTEDE